MNRRPLLGRVQVPKRQSIDNGQSKVQTKVPLGRDVRLCPLSLRSRPRAGCFLDWSQAITRKFLRNVAGGIISKNQGNS